MGVARNQAPGELASSRRVKRVVLYFPQLADSASGAVSSKHVLPLSLLTIAAGPLADGFEVLVIDGNLTTQEAAHRRVLEACEGALVFGATGILGYQVADGAALAEKVRQRFPRLFRVAGGWFANALPELYLEDGLYDAVALGQGELTFRELVAALDSGARIETVRGLALWRDGRMQRTPAREIVGWDKLSNCAWSLLDFEPYRSAQLQPAQRRSVEALPVPQGWPEHKPFVAISYYSSFGCPLPCAFCCSPQFSERRWKSMGGERVADDLAELRARWNFDGVNFFDANWGVAEPRVRDLAQGLLARGVNLRYYPYLQAQSLLAYRPATLDLLAESGLYVACIGAESGDDQTMALVEKPTRGDDNLHAAELLEARGVMARMSYMIGLPGESEASMLATLDQSRRIALACPRSAPAIWPYHPIPGSALYAKALEAGFEPPRTLADWGRFCDYRHGESWRRRIPKRVLERRALYAHFVNVMRGATPGASKTWRARARRRLERNDFRLGALEAKAFDWHQRWFVRLFPDPAAH